MKNAEIFKTQDGSIGLYNRELNEIYHSREGAQKESIEKFILPSCFKERSENADNIRLLDICYGIGYNSKNALNFYKNCDIIIDALEYDGELIEYSKTAEFINPEINEFLSGRKMLGNSKINFYVEDARITIKMLKESYDVIFLDAFAPNKLPTLWSVEFFKQLKRLIKQDGVLVTYCSAQPVRHALKLAGFCVGKILDENGHSRTTVAALNDDTVRLSAVLLNDYDLGFLNTKAAIPYRDEKLCLSADEMIKNRQKEVEQSMLEGASSYIKRKVAP